MKDIEYQWKRDGFSFDAMATSGDLEILGTKILVEGVLSVQADSRRQVSFAGWL